MNQQELIEKLSNETKLEFKEHEISGELCARGSHFGYWLTQNKNDYDITWQSYYCTNVTRNISLAEAIKIIKNKEIV